jgi:hypothetical protein
LGIKNSISGTKTNVNIKAIYDHASYEFSDTHPKKGLLYTKRYLSTFDFIFLKFKLKKVVRICIFYEQETP